MLKKHRKRKYEQTKKKNHIAVCLFAFRSEKEKKAEKKNNDIGDVGSTAEFVIYDFVVFL